MQAGTPLHAQYTSLKAQVPGAILMFRLGDFYELFYEDATLAAPLLELTLTSRNKQDDNPVPMAGVPAHSAAAYVNRLVELGYRVAIAEQVEEPGLSKLVKREIVRIVTPGVPWDPNSLDAREPNWLLCVCSGPAGLGLATLDASTGTLRAAGVADPAALVGEIQRVEPREVLIGPGVVVDGLDVAIKRLRCAIGPVDPEWFTVEAAWAEAESVADGVMDRAHRALPAVGAVLRYARETLRGRLANVRRVEVLTLTGHLVLDEAARRHLEIARTLMGGERKGSLLALLDRCGTAPGARLLRDWLSFPLLDTERIAARASAVEALVSEAGAREEVQSALALVADIERIVARVAQGTASPRELAALRRSLEAAPQIAAPLRSLIPLAEFMPSDDVAELREDLQHWLVDEPAQTLDEGGVIRPSADPELERVTGLAIDGLSQISALEERERAATGITSLKVRRNDLAGWYIEVTKANAHRVPDRYTRKQTLSTSERYLTPELRELDEDLRGAESRRIRIERDRFAELRTRCADSIDRLARLARRLATLDVLCALADVAVRHRLVRPIVDESYRIELIGSRHPVVEASLDEERFVPNDVTVDADEQRMIMLTGPNMAGKSTVLRQVALCVLLAQIGSFVPCDRARIGLVDRIYTRVGAADELHRGQSTFMVEMSETANLLRGATARSLVVMDEIGRGTSTYDGLAIAWAVAEDLAAKIRCRTLFATHYHELCALAEQIEGVANRSIAVHESGDRIVFLRTLKEGGASRSYGVQCARLAGVPDRVIDRARELLRRFERGAPRDTRNQLSLFGAVPEAAVEEPKGPDLLRERLRGIDVDALSPRQAQELIYELKGMLET